MFTLGAFETSQIGWLYRYYNPETGRFINADSYVATGQGFVGNNMFAYCGNNPVMMKDATGESRLLTILGCIAIAALILIIASSEQQKASEAQLKTAEEAVGRADIEIKYPDSSKNIDTGSVEKPDNQKATIEIHIDTKDARESVDNIAMGHYFDSLYERTVVEATENNIPVENLMDVWHINWEFGLHLIAYDLGFDAAVTTDLNVEETPWSMFTRAVGWT